MNVSGKDAIYYNYYTLRPTGMSDFAITLEPQLDDSIWNEFNNKTGNMISTGEEKQNIIEKIINGFSKYTIMIIGFVLIVFILLTLIIIW